MSIWDNIRVTPDPINPAQFLVMSPYESRICYNRLMKRYKRVVLWNKIIDFFDPQSVRNLSKDEAFSPVDKND